MTVITNQFTGCCNSNSTFTMTVITVINLQGQYIYQDCSNCNQFTGNFNSDSTFTITVKTVINLQGAVPEKGSGAGKPW